MANTFILSATSSSSNNVLSVAVPGRSSQLHHAFYCPVAPQTVPGTIDVTVNGSTVAGLSQTITTSTWGTSTYWIAPNSTTGASSGPPSVYLGAPSHLTYLQDGDVLGSVGSNLQGGTITFIVKEY